jgi:hypothetical protein
MDLTPEIKLQLERRIRQTKDIHERMEFKWTQIMFQKMRMIIAIEI